MTHTGMAKVGSNWIPKTSIMYQRLLAKGLVKQRILIPVSPRERTAYVKLRKIGYSINHIAQAFGRSTSIIHAIIKKAENIGSIRKISNRKLPRFSLLQGCRRRLFTLLSMIPKWNLWILSEEGDIP